MGQVDNLSTSTMDSKSNILYLAPDAPEGIDPMQHNYMKKIARWKPAEGVHEISVQHDSWCAIYKGEYCNCDPFLVNKRTGKRIA